MLVSCAVESLELKRYSQLDLRPQASKAPALDAVVWPSRGQGAARANAL